MTAGWTADSRTALIVVDVQRGFDDTSWWGPRNNPACESNIAALIARWRRDGRPLVFVQHDSLDPESPLHPSQPGNAMKAMITGLPDVLIRKSVNSSFHGAPDLDRWLRGEHITRFAICGITTNHCCETTARVGGNLGYDVAFVLDATHTFDRIGPDGVTVDADLLARITATNVHDEFATVVTTADLVV